MKERYSQYIEEFFKENIFNSNNSSKNPQNFLLNISTKFQQINIDRLLSQVFKDEELINKNRISASNLLKILEILSKYFDKSKFIELIYFYPFSLARNKEHFNIFNLISKNIRAIINSEKNEFCLNYVKNKEKEIKDLYETLEINSTKLENQRVKANDNTITKQQILNIKNSWMWPYIQNIYQSQIENKESEIKDCSSDTSSVGNNQVSNLSDDLERSNDNHSELIDLSNDSSSNKKSKSNKHTKNVDVPLKIENKINRKSKKIQKEEQSNCLLNKKMALETLTKGIFEASSSSKKKKNSKKSKRKEKVTQLYENSEISRDNLKSILLYDESNCSSSLNSDENIQHSKNEESNIIIDDLSKIEISKKEEDNSQDLIRPFYYSQRYYLPKQAITYVKKSQPATPDPSSISLNTE